MEEIERLLAQAEQDAIEASDEAMRLIAKFGNDPLLLEFVATGNELKTRARRFIARKQQLSRELPSLSRNVKIQLLLTEVTALKTDAGRFKATVTEIGRND